tara:strand:- start:89 stop:352 length:264 start_codon:yes stop_codon:yes gene_type:complete
MSLDPLGLGIITNHPLLPKPHYFRSEVMDENKTHNYYEPINRGGSSPILSSELSGYFGILNCTISAFGGVSLGLLNKVSKKTSNTKF